MRRVVDTLMKTTGFDNVKKYILEKQQKLPDNVICSNMNGAVSDPLTVAKIAFFVSAAAEVEPTLKKYQSSAPLAAFLYDDGLIVCHMQ